MADYTAGTGSGGVLMIRDTGWNVEFWVYTSSSPTWGEGFGWGGRVNGVNVGGAFNYYQGSPWIRVASYPVGTNQTVTFNIGATGTIGLGGPASVSAWIQRATVPQAPTPLSLDMIGHTTIRYRFSGNSDGGSPIREWQIGFGTDPKYVQAYTPSSGTTIVGQNGQTLGLGTRYYFWSRGRNDVGWGPWSARMDARTLAGARVMYANQWREAVAWVKWSNQWRQAIPFIKHNGVWKDGK